MAAHSGSRNKIFTPNESVLWAHAMTRAMRPLPSTDFPIQVDGDPDHFPFPPPILFGTNGPLPPMRPRMMCPRQVAIAPRSTADKYSPVKSLKGQNSLQTVLRSDLIWDRCIAFALGPGQQLATGHENLTIHEVNGVSLSNRPSTLPNPPPQVNPLTINAWNDWAQGLIALPTPDAQAQTIRGLVELWFTQLRRPTPFVNSEPASQFEFIRQIIKPVNLYIQARIIRPASLYADQYPTKPEDEEISRRELEMLKYYPDAHLLSKCRYPSWGRTVYQERLPATGQNHSGYADMLLYSEGLPGRHPAIAEVKTFWTYPTETFHNIWTHGIAIDSDGKFYGGRKSHVGQSVLSQVWIQLIAFDSKFGLWTNTEVIALCMRTGKNELTFSYTRPWTDPHALIAIVGLSLAAILSQAPDADERMIIDELCPPASRLTPAQEGI